MKIGDPVNKVRGYRFPGVIVSVFTNTAGETRYVVEATGTDYKGMLHIFNGDQLMPVKDLEDMKIHRYHDKAS